MRQASDVLAVQNLCRAVQAEKAQPELVTLGVVVTGFVGTPSQEHVQQKHQGKEKQTTPGCSPRLSSFGDAWGG